MNPLRSLPLGYCANVHPGPGLARLLDGVMATAPVVAASLREDGSLGERDPFPIGLWLSDEASRELAQPGEAEGLRDRLRRRGIVVGGLNGFPFGDFHDRIVKHAVYEPHWADPRRLDFTVRLAEVLARLVPEGTVSSGVTTVPIGWRAAFEDAGRVEAAKSSLAETIEALRAIRDRTGVLVHLDLEPEPGCLLERAVETAEFIASVHERAGTPEAREFLRACHDVCHAAVLFEEQEASLAAYRERGVQIGRVQVSSAIAFDGTANDFRALRPFDEPRWLHQTAVLEGNGRVHFYEDLPKAIDEAPEGFWRIHFHVPVFAASLGKVETTREEIAECLGALRVDDGCDFLEVETYAWSALPPSLRPTSLEAGIAEEIRYVRGLI
ncbi:MAG: metabolite traffic protein EboE [Phycisphaerales bacterium]